MDGVFIIKKKSIRAFRIPKDAEGSVEKEESQKCIFEYFTTA